MDDAFAEQQQLFEQLLTHTFPRLSGETYNAALRPTLELVSRSGQVLINALTGEVESSRNHLYDYALTAALA